MQPKKVIHTTYTKDVIANKKHRYNEASQNTVSGGGGTTSQADALAKLSGFANAEEMIMFQQQQLMNMMQQQPYVNQSAQYQSATGRYVY